MVGCTYTRLTNSAVLISHVKLCRLLHLTLPWMDSDLCACSLVGLRFEMSFLFWTSLIGAGMYSRELRCRMCCPFLSIGLVLLLPRGPGLTCGGGVMWCYNIDLGLMVGRPPHSYASSL